MCAGDGAHACTCVYAHVCVCVCVLCVCVCVRAHAFFRKCVCIRVCHMFTGEMYRTEEDEEQLRRQAKSQALSQWVFSQASLKPLRRNQGISWEDVASALGSAAADRVPRSLRQEVVKLLRAGR